MKINNISNINLDSSNTLYHKEMIKIINKLDSNQDLLDDLIPLIESKKITKKYKKHLIKKYNVLTKSNKKLITQLDAFNKCKNNAFSLN